MAVVFPDATFVVVSHLADALDVPVLSRVPTSRPAAFVVIRRVGGVRRNEVTDEPMLVVECWAASDEAAADLAAAARAHVDTMVGQVVENVAVYDVTDVSGPQYLPDSESNQPRYSFTFTAAMRGATLA
jgi:hypothetical protein